MEEPGPGDVKDFPLCGTLLPYLKSSFEVPTGDLRPATENVTAQKRQHFGGTGDQAREGHLLTLSTVFGWGSKLKEAELQVGQRLSGNYLPPITFPLVLLHLCSPTGHCRFSVKSRAAESLAKR